MDNCAFAAENTEHLTWVHGKLGGIFSSYKFYLHQFLTNDPSLQDLIDKELGSEMQASTKLLGLQWNKHSTALSTKHTDFVKHC